MRRRRLFARIACAVFALACMPAECDQAGAMMRLYGYTALKAPNMLLLPGTLVTVTSHHPFAANIVCGPWASLGPEWKPQRSPTASIQMRKVNGKTFALDAELMEHIKGDARFKSVQEITGTLSNGVILEVRDEDIAANMGNRSDECKYVIQKRLASGFPITMISSALVGTVEYKVSFSSEANLDVKARVDTTTALAIEMAVGAQTVTDTTIKATGMVWGIKDDEWLASLSIPDLDETTISPGTRHIQPEMDADIIPIPEAPVVTPVDRTNSSTLARDVVRERHFKKPPMPNPEKMTMYRKMRERQTMRERDQYGTLFEGHSGATTPVETPRGSDDLGTSGSPFDAPGFRTPF